MAAKSNIYGIVLRSFKIAGWNLPFLVFAVIFLLTEFPTPSEAWEKKPNFVLVLADDLGYGDLGCYGNKVIKTPFIDNFAKNGLRLTNCYSAGANCSPSRAGLMTGRTPTRVGIHNWIPMLSPMHLREREVTIATLLRNAGYDTCHVGKWHLNGRFNLEGQPQPNDHGFNYWFSTQNNALPNHHNPDNFVRNGKEVGKLKGYSSELVVNEAINWLAKKRDRKKPFFLFVCFHEPHEPIASAEKFSRIYKFQDPSKVAHHGNITQMDFAFGRLLQALDRMNLDDNTIVFLTSDNGPAITRIHPHGSSGPLRAKKGHLYEGGIRVPGILSWRSKIKPGQTSEEPVSGVDVLPTFCAVAGIPLAKNRKIDGASILPILEAKKIDRSVPLYWHFNAARSAPKVAMRKGDWMLLAELTGPQIKPGGGIRAGDQKALHSAELKSFELYNLRNDIGQQNNLATKELVLLKQLSQQMRNLYREVRDDSPTWPAWTWPRHESKRIIWPPYYKKRSKK